MLLKQQMDNYVQKPVSAQYEMERQLKLLKQQMDNYANKPPPAQCEMEKQLLLQQVGNYVNKPTTAQYEMREQIPVQKPFRRGKEGVLCYACRGMGHFARDCASKQQNPPSQGEGGYSVANKWKQFSRGTTDPNDTQVKVSRVGSKDFPVYLNLEINDKTVSCLVDTGCESSLIPGRLVDDLGRLDVHLPKVSAANGTTITIAGSRKFSIKLNGVKFGADMLVSFAIEEAMTGVDFLMQHNTC